MHQAQKLLSERRTISSGAEGLETGGVFTHRVCGVHRFLWGADEIILLVDSRLVVQDVLLDHLEVPVFPWDVAVFQGDEEGVSVLPLKPLLGFQGGFGPSCVRIEVILKEVRLGKKESGKKKQASIRSVDLPRTTRSSRTNAGEPGSPSEGRS